MKTLNLTFYVIAINFEKKSTPLGLGAAFKGQMNETESLVAWEIAPLQRFVEPFNQRQTQKGHTIRRPNQEKGSGP